MKKGSVVLYKNLPAIVGESEGDKFMITCVSKNARKDGKKTCCSAQKVREKDVLLLCGDCAESADFLLDFADEAAKENSAVKAQIEETYELLLSDEQAAASFMPFSELASLIRGEFKADESWGIYNCVLSSFNFEKEIRGNSVYFRPRSKQEAEEARGKVTKKTQLAEERNAFIARLKNRAILPEDSLFMGDVESLALGQTAKSRTLRDIGIKDTPENAHRLLLETGIWQITRNPYPSRFGLSMQSATEDFPSPPEEQRITIEETAYAIDNAWSDDPDDAVAWDGKHLWVHIADPACAILPDSAADKAARNRGTTLYFPEGIARMLRKDCLEDYALGIKKEKSRALSFKITLSERCEIEDCQVIRTFVNVKRLTYEQADKLKDSPELKPLFEIARRAFKRRMAMGAVNIVMPELRIKVDPETQRVSIEPIAETESASVVKEAMILAGEAAAGFAVKNAIPFPFISQEAFEILNEIPSGLAGQVRLRKSMKKRNVSTTPSIHAGLGLSLYSQVTSPLRRYTDLLSHEQLRAFIKGDPLIDKDTLFAKMSAGEAATYAARKAERNTLKHWALVYLMQNPDWTGKAICVEKAANQSIFLIPSLGLEAALSATGCDLNEQITVKPTKVDLPDLAAQFIQI